MFITKQEIKMVSEGSLSKKVCVIGAGPAGLVAARELKRSGHEVVVIEQRHEVGGQWLYEPKVEEEHPMGRTRLMKVHSSVYASLRVMSPREIMGFSDFPFVGKVGRDTRRFPGHEEILCYLKDFCNHFGLREIIRFNTWVENVEMLDYPVLEKEQLKWVVKSRAAEEKVVEEVYDAVVVASGHYTRPRLPAIEGMDSWKRRQMHSHIYRVPDPFKNEVVVVVGSAISGQDISIELVKAAKEVYLSSKSLDVSEGLRRVVEKYDNFHLRPQIESLHEDGKVLFTDGSWTVADTIIYCTGYSFSFPYLDTKGIVRIDDNRVGPLYEHTFPPSLAPSLCFIGIPKKIIGFPFFESQAIWIAQVLSGKKSLPSWDDMMQSIEQFYESKEAAGVPKHYTHDIGEFEYCDQYADLAGCPRLEEWRKVLCISALVNARSNLETYRDSYDDEENLRVAYTSPHFTQHGPIDSTLLKLHI